MINIETLQKGPYAEEEEPEEISAGEFKETIRKTIQYTVDYVNKRFRLSSHYGSELVGFTGGQEHADIPYSDSRIDAKSAQEVLFDVMREFGLADRDESMGCTTPGWQENTLKEIQYYPSNKTRGLFFKRERSYYADSGMAYQVAWSVEPKVSLIKFPPF